MKTQSAIRLPIRELSSFALCGVLLTLLFSSPAIAQEHAGSAPTWAATPNGICPENHHCAVGVMSGSNLGAYLEAVAEVGRFLGTRVKSKYLNPAKNDNSMSSKIALRQGLTCEWEMKELTRPLTRDSAGPNTEPHDSTEVRVKTGEGKIDARIEIRSLEIKPAEEEGKGSNRSLTKSTTECSFKEGATLADLYSRVPPLRVARTDNGDEFVLVAINPEDIITSD